MDFSAEHCFVSNILRYPEELKNVLEIVQPEDIKSVEIRSVYKAMIDLQREEQPITIPFIFERAKCNPTLLSQMLDVLPERRNIKKLAELVAKPVSNVSTVSNISSSRQPSAERQQNLKNVSRDDDSSFESAFVRNWITETPGIFKVFDLDREFNIFSRQDKNKRSALLKRMKEQGFITPYGQGRGVWKAINNDFVKMSLSNTKPQAIELPLPLGVSDLVKVYPGSIIVVAGEPNSGKSAYVTTLIQNIYNSFKESADVSSTNYAQKISEVISPELDECKIRYLNSEIGEEEMTIRLQNYNLPISVFKKAEWIERSTDFADVILPNGVNIIDYMEIYDNFWEIGGWINDVHKKLKKGIAIIVIQKKSGSDIGRGGEMTLEKPRLYLSLRNNAPHGGICKIVKAKIFKKHDVNPNGLEIDYKLIKGSTFIEISEWRYVNGEKDRVKINAGYMQDKIDQMEAKDYVFEFLTVENETVRLNQRDFNKWAAAFKHISVYDELCRIADTGHKWLKKKSWYYQVPAQLDKINQKSA